MTDQAALQALLQAVERYFDLIYDCDVSRFEAVFAPSAQLHGFSDGQMSLLTAPDYKGVLAARPSPKSKKAPRQQEVLLIDLASPTQALVKVRVRIDPIVYVDYLNYHHIEGRWLITAKSFHVESRGE